MEVQCDKCENEATRINEPDPFMQDIYNETVLCNLCESCYWERCEEI